MDNGAIGFFLFFVILIIIWIFAMGGCVRERNSLGVYEGMTKSDNNKGENWNNLDSNNNNSEECYENCIKENNHAGKCMNNC